MHMLGRFPLPWAQSDRILAIVASNINFTYHSHAMLCLNFAENITPVFFFLSDQMSHQSTILLKLCI